MGAGEEEFSHSEGASWGKIQEFSAAVEGRQAGRGDGDRPGIAAPTALARGAHVTLPALPGLWHLGTEVLGSPTCQWCLSHGQRGSVGSLWPSHECGVEGALPAPSSPPARWCPSPGFCGMRLPHSCPCCGGAGSGYRGPGAQLEPQGLGYVDTTGPGQPQEGTRGAGESWALPRAVGLWRQHGHTIFKGEGCS